MSCVAQRAIFGIARKSQPQAVCEANGCEDSWTVVKPKEERVKPSLTVCDIVYPRSDVLEPAPVLCVS